MIELSIKKVACCAIFTIAMPAAINAQVAKVGETEYQTLTEAFNSDAAKNGGTIQLVADADISECDANSRIHVLKGSTTTLDLNGYSVKAANTSYGQIWVEGDFTLKDSKENSTGRIYTETKYQGDPTGKCVIDVYGNGSFTLESGIVEAVYSANPSNYGNFGVGAWDKAKVTINGGTIKAGWYTIAGYGNNPGSNTTIIVNGGELISQADYSIYNPQIGTVTINEGAVVYGYAGGIAMKRGNLIVNGGTITSKGVGNTGTWGDGTGNLNNAALNFQNRYGDVTATIKGGKIVAEGNAIAIDAPTSGKGIEVCIEGGEFSSDVTDYCPEGSAASKGADGKYEIVSGDIIIAHEDGTKSVVKVEEGSAVTLDFKTEDLTKLSVAKKIENANVKMEKTYSTTNWISFFAPFNIKVTADVLQKFNLATIEAAQESGDIQVNCVSATDGQTIAAGTPCLIKSKTAGANVLELTGVDIKTIKGGSITKTVGDYKLTFTGVTANTTLLDKYGYYLNATEQMFRPVSKPTAYIKPMTFYLTIQDKDDNYVYPGLSNSTSAKAIKLNVEDGETTGVSEISVAKTSVNKVYNLQGVCVGSDANVLPAGMYIVNGKKIVKK